MIKNNLTKKELFASRLKTVLVSIIPLEQTVYIEKRFIAEDGRLVFDILSVTDNSKIKIYLLTMDIEKALQSLYHSFLTSVF